MMTFNDFVHKYKLKNKAATKIKVFQILSSTGSNNVGIYLRDGSFECDVRIFSFHPFRGSHWTLYIYENYFDSYGCGLMKNYLSFLQKVMDIVYILNTK